MLERFAVIDVETANSDPASICAIGIAVFENEKLVYDWYSLVNPSVRFERRNTKIHGLTEFDVATAPKLELVVSYIWRALDGANLLSHGTFDQSAIEALAKKSGVHGPKCRWIDTVNLARIAFPGLGKYSLPIVCEHLGYPLLNHHNALDDAKAAGHIGWKCRQKIGLEFSEISSSNFSFGQKIRRETSSIEYNKPLVGLMPSSKGKYYGQRIVFTGDLGFCTKVEASEKAANIGFEVADSMSKKVNFLVLGKQDLIATKGSEISGKHRRALELRENGADINFIQPEEFRRMINE